MRVIRKIIFFLAISLSLIIIREFIAIYTDLITIDPLYGIIFIILISIIFIYFVLIPLVQIIRTPKIPAPVTNAGEVNKLMESRIQIFESSGFLKDSTIQNKPLKEKYEAYISVLEKEAQKIRSRYVINVFYSTAISQNGFLDGIIILSAGINVIKDIFKLYNGRVSNKDLWMIIRKIYTAMAIGGSEIIQYSTDEIIPLITTKGVQTIPLFDKIVASAADGFVNAAMISRIALITENYCKLTLIKSDKDLLPSYKTVYDTTKNILGDIFSKIKNTLPLISLKDDINFAKYYAAPFKYVASKIDSFKNNKSNAIGNENNTFSSMISKLIPGFSSKRKD